MELVFKNSSGKGTALAVPPRVSFDSVVPFAERLDFGGRSAFQRCDKASVLLMGFSPGVWLR